MALGWAIIGAGMHPQQKLAPAIGLTPDAELIGVLSRDQGRADAFAEAHGAKVGYSNLDDLLADSRIDAVFVASPNAAHVGHTVQAAKAGKHVLSEKPMATSVPDALAMVEACKANGVKLGLGFELRFHPAHLLARDLVSQGKLGRVRLLQGHWGRGERGEPEHLPRSGLRGWWEDPAAMGGGSVIMGLGVHVFDLMRFIMQQEITEVSAMTDGQTDAQPLEHIATMALRLEDGTIANVSCGRMLPDTLNDFTVYGTDGRITGHATIWEARMGDVEVVSETVNQKESWEYDYLANFVAELEDFHAALKEDREPAATGTDGLRSTEINVAVIESARTGRAVKIQHRQV
ncbi:MAG: Gfo/Idh/MocA family oxidoreductase [SAR202 cluster bacterium]|nr:Gfo/Idh/MocA family oxidoreductase [SAR202 cluster bacterium]